MKDPLRAKPLWIIPVSLATVGLTTLLLINPEHGAVVATILALPVGVIAAVAGILAIRSGARRPVPGTTRTRVWLITSLVTAAAVLIAVGYAVIDVRGESAATRLRGTVRIGISGVIPGWSEVVGENEYQGFEIELVNQLMTKYRFTPKYLLLSPAQLGSALDDGTVDLVIANFSNPNTRNMTIEFSGPYYIDRSGIYVSPSKLKAAPTPENVVGCTDFDPFLPHPFATPFKRFASLQDCLIEYFDPNSTTNAVMMNYSILASLSISRGDAGRPMPFEEFETVGYGIGMKKVKGTLCSDLTRDVDSFLRLRWDDAARLYLPFATSVQKPLYGNLNYCR